MGDIYDTVLCIVCGRNVQDNQFDIGVHRKSHTDRENGHATVTLDSGRVDKLNILERELEDREYDLEQWRERNLAKEKELESLQQETEDRHDTVACIVCGEDVPDYSFDYQRHMEKHQRDAVEASLFGPCGYEPPTISTTVEFDDLFGPDPELPKPDRETSADGKFVFCDDVHVPDPHATLAPIKAWGDMYLTSSFEQTFADVYHTAFKLLVERQRKYGPENIEQLGLWGVFGRMGDDKIERLRRAFNGTIKGGKIEIDLSDGHGDESVDDTLLDIANYALIMYVLKHGLWGKPLEEDM